MNRYDYIAEADVFIIYLFGIAEGDEIDSTILRAAREHPEWAAKVRSVLVDVRDVQRFDLTNTDHARVTHWAEEMARTLNIRPEDLAGYIQNIRVARLVDERSEALPIFMERVRRTTTTSASGYSIDRGQDTVSSLEEAAEFLGVDVKVIESKLTEIKGQLQEKT